MGGERREDGEPGPARQELSISNDKLVAANAALAARAAELSRLYDDLHNVLASTGIPILLLARDGRLRRFTPPAAAMFSLFPADVGKPFAGIVHRLRARTPDLPAVPARALARLTAIDRMVQDEAGRWYQLTARPYVTTGGQVDGTVVTFVDIDPLKRSEEAAEAMVAEYQEKLRAMAFDAALVEERERRRIAADLHDHIGQSLALAQIRLGALRDTVADEARAPFEACLRLIEQSIAEARTLTFDLSPPILYDLGLDAALGWLGEHLAERHGLAVSVDAEGGHELDADVASILFRVVRELLMNVVKHASCAQATVTLRRQNDDLAIVVQDGGVGFDPAVVDTHALRGFGLFSVREQMGRLGGSVELASALGAGTRVRLSIPFSSRVTSSRRPTAW